MAMLIPSGVLRLTAVATTSFKPADGLLSAGKVDRTPAIPAVMFYTVRRCMCSESGNLPDG
jgi:hypothetical protein